MLFSKKSHCSVRRLLLNQRIVWLHHNCLSLCPATHSTAVQEYSSFSTTSHVLWGDEWSVRKQEASLPPPSIAPGNIFICTPCLQPREQLYSRVLFEYGGARWNLRGEQTSSSGEHEFQSNLWHNSSNYFFEDVIHSLRLNLLDEYNCPIFHVDHRWSVFISNVLMVNMRRSCNTSAASHKQGCDI